MLTSLRVHFLLKCTHKVLSQVSVGDFMSQMLTVETMENLIDSYNIDKSNQLIRIHDLMLSFV